METNQPSSNLENRATASEGVIVSAPTPFGEMRRVSASGGESLTITSRGDSESGLNHRFPQFL